MSYYEKYLKYKQKYINLKNYLDLKNNFQKGGAPLFADDTLIETIITSCKENIRENIRRSEEKLVPLSQEQITSLNITRLGETNQLGKGQYGVVYDLSPSYAIKKLSIIQNGKNKLDYINNEIKVSYFVEYLNITIPLYSGNLAHFTDGTNFYIIMKKYKNIDELETSVDNDAINDLDVAISLISQLYIIVKYAALNTLEHGDAKFDNLLFEKCDATIPIFSYNIGVNTYTFKNCGFKLRLIDWGEASNTTVMSNNWDANWLDNINKGIQNIKKSPGAAAGAPTSDYLVRICKIMGVLDLNKTHDKLEEYYPTINKIVAGDVIEIEKIKLSVILGEPEKDTILNKFATIKIANIFTILKELYDKKDNNFLNFSGIVQPKDVDLSLLPNFKFISTTGNCNGQGDIKEKIIMEYCTPKYKEATVVNICDFLTNIDKYLSTQLKDPECNTRNLESGTANFYIIKNTKYTIDTVKAKLEELFGTLSIYKQKDGKYIYINKTNLFITKQRDDDIELYIYNISPSSSKEIMVDINNLKGRVISKQNEIIQLFNFIKDAVNRSGNNIVLFPLGFFHIHLTYNDNLKKFFCIIHAKIEVSIELGAEHMNRAEGYLKKLVEYKDIPTTCVDLTGPTQENILNHNYICEINNNNDINIYKMKCKPDTEIIMAGLGIDNRFFNVPPFADLNYYGDSRITLKTEYVLINKVSANMVEGGYKKNDSNEFYKRNVPYCLPQEGGIPKGPWTDEEYLSVPESQRNMYVSLRSIGMSHIDSLPML